MTTAEVIEIVAPYCDKIRHGRKHWVCYPKGTNITISISGTSSDNYFHTQVFREFRRRAGITIEALRR